MKPKKSSVTLLIIWCAIIISINAQCEYDISKDTPFNQPIYIVPGTNSFFIPTYDKYARSYFIDLQKGEKLEMWCTGPWQNLPPDTPNVITVSCDNNNKLLYTNKGDSYRFDLSQFECQFIPHTIEEKRTGSKCSATGTYVDVDYVVNSGGTAHRVTLYKVCHDSVLRANNYVYHKLHQYAYGGQKGVDSTNWESPFNFYPRDTVGKYSIYQQRITLASILHVPGNTYIPDNAGPSRERFTEPTDRDKFLSRGHLAPKADFIFASWQHATFNFLNAAPQWQCFNAFNWEAVEIWTRDQAKYYDDGLEIYTGTHEILTMTTSNIQVFLDIKRKIPVPRLFYKIIISETLAKGVVFIGVNDPYVISTPVNKPKYVICKDISQQLQFTSFDGLGSKRKNKFRGFVYACEVDDFLRSTNLQRYINLGHRSYNLLGRL